MEISANHRYWLPLLFGIAILGTKTLIAQEENSNNTQEKLILSGSFMVQSRFWILFHKVLMIPFFPNRHFQEQFICRSLMV